MRRGELRGQLWSDIDLTAEPQSVTVTHNRVSVKRQDDGFPDQQVANNSEDE